MGPGASSSIRAPACGGHGAVERPRKVTVTFPAGIDAGQRLRVPGQGLPGPNGVPPGDLYVEIDVEDDPRFERDGVDLVTRVHVPFTDAALGADIQVPGLEADDEAATVAVSIPPGTQSSAMFTLKSHGVPRLDGRGRGSLVVVVHVDVPTVLTTRARELLQALSAELKPGDRRRRGRQASRVGQVTQA